MILYLSRQEPVIQGSRRAMLGSACLFAVAAYFCLPMLAWLFTDGLWALWTGKVGLLFGILAAWASVTVFLWQRTWGWLDRETLLGLFSLLRGNTAYTEIVNDLPLHAESRAEGDDNAGPEASGNAASGCKQRRRTLRAVRFCLFSIHPYFIRGVGFLLACLLFSVLAGSAESGTMAMIGWGLQGAAWIHWLIAAYNTL